MKILSVVDRTADKAEAIAKARRVVVLRASWETQEKMREWAQEQGFDLAWSYSGWPQHSHSFDFHVTIVASENEVRIPDEVRMIDPITVEADGYEVLGQDRRVPCLKLSQHKTLTAIRDFFIEAFGVVPTFADYKPHISLSYKWDGEPLVESSSPSLPPFPLVFDLLMVGTIDDPVKANDAAGRPIKVLSHSDRAAISGTRRTKDGYLVTEARVARGGNIQDYYGHEIGEGEANQLFKVWRPDDEIFKAESLSTFAHKPITLDHPAIGVTPDNFRKEAVGHVGSEVLRDGEFVRVPLVVMDGKAIEAIETGTREISMGYDCELVMQSGTTPDGRSYDAFQRNIRINHCAVVKAGRAGPQCRIGDSFVRNTQQQKDTPAMKTVTIDGKAFEVTDEAAVAIQKLQADTKSTLSEAGPVLDQARALIADLKGKQEEADKAVADAKAEAEEAKKAVPSADALAKMVSDLAAVVDAAKAIAPDLDTKGLTADAVKAAAVKAVLGEDALKDKDAAYVSAAFDLIGRNANDADPVRNAIKSGVSTGDARTKAFDEFNQRYHTTMGR